MNAHTICKVVLFFAFAWLLPVAARAGDPTVVIVQGAGGANHGVGFISSTNNGDGTVDVKVRDPNDPNNPVTIKVRTSDNKIIDGPPWYKGGKVIKVVKLKKKPQPVPAGTQTTTSHGQQ